MENNNKTNNTFLLINCFFPKKRKKGRYPLIKNFSRNNTSLKHFYTFFFIFSNKTWENYPKIKKNPKILGFRKIIIISTKIICEISFINYQRNSKIDNEVIKIIWSNIELQAEDFDWYKTEIIIYKELSNSHLNDEQFIGVSHRSH